MSVWDERYQGKKPEKKLNPQLFSRTDVQDRPLKRNAEPVAIGNVSDPRTRMSKARIMSEETGRPVTADEVQTLWDQSAAEQREIHRRNIAAREEKERIAAENRRRTEAEHAEARRLAAQRDKEYLEQRAVALSIA